MGYNLSESQMITLYRDAKDKEKQITILAELNACGTDTITDILRRHGYELPFSKTA